jgi:hypothetical protein
VRHPADQETFEAELLGLTDRAETLGRSELASDGRVGAVSVLSQP